MAMAMRALALSLLLLMARCGGAQEPNTDAFYLASFFDQMGAGGGGRRFTAAAAAAQAGNVCTLSGVTCDATGEKVTALVAAGLGLAGAIPDTTVGKLHSLSFLDLSDNLITTLPSDFWELGGSLERLDLSRNLINGTLPNNIGNFGRLESLDLSGNQLSGELPAAIGSIAALLSLNLSGNQFNGSLSSDIVAGCKNLVSVDLSANAISGPLPDLSPMGKLSFLNVSGNRMTGPVDGVLRGRLEVVDLSNNGFDGSVSQVSGSSSLTYLDLSANALGGELFGDFSKFAAMKHVNVAGNRFSVQPFPSFGENSQLEYVNLSRSCIAGSIPPELSKMTALKTLDLSGNYITGEVPDMSLDGELTVLDLSSNNLTGEIPMALQKRLPELRLFNFSYNNLTFCGSQLPEYASLFIGSRSECPIAVDPNHGGFMQSGHHRLSLQLTATVSAFFLLLALLFLAFTYWRRRSKDGGASIAAGANAASFEQEPPTLSGGVMAARSIPVVVFEKPLLNMTFADLLSATSNFDGGALLAEGRFGPVHRGFLPGGIHVAVKVLVHGLTMADADAARELERLGRIKHQNLVPLIGYCFAGDRIAIYEFMEHGNLHNLLHCSPSSAEDWSADVNSGDTATWRFRHKIALGAARALAFLHHGCIPEIVHRDVKASSIFFDSDMEPRLADVGLSMIARTIHADELPDDETSAVTVKSDVHGFGVVLFELVTGKRPVGDDYPGGEKDGNLVSWARAVVKSNSGGSIVDPKIRDTGPEKQMEEALRIAYLCTADSPSKRPTMQQIVGLLKDIDPKAAGG